MSKNEKFSMKIGQIVNKMVNFSIYFVNFFQSLITPKSTWILNIQVQVVISLWFEFFIIFVLFTNNPAILPQFCTCHQILIPKSVQIDWKNPNMINTGKMAGLLVK